MTALATVALVVPFLDLSIKHVVAATLSGRSLSLGALGAMRPVRRQIRLMRARRQPALAVLWAIWPAFNAAAVALTAGGLAVVIHVTGGAS